MDTEIESIQVFDGTDYIPEYIQDLLKIKDLKISELEKKISELNENLERGKRTNGELLYHVRGLEFKLRRLEDFIGDSIPEEFYPDLP